MKQLFWYKLPKFNSKFSEFKFIMWLKPALHHPFNWNQLFVQYSQLKHVGYYTFQLTDDICWILSVFLLRFFPSMANTIHSFLFLISRKVWTCFNTPEPNIIIHVVVLLCLMCLFSLYLSTFSFCLYHSFIIASISSQATIYLFSKSIKW